MRIIEGLWRRRPILLTSFTIAVILSILFGFKAIAHYNDDRDRLAKPVAGWMTPRFIARTYDVELDEIVAVLGVDDDGDTRLTLARLARESGTPRRELVSKVEELIDRQHPGRKD